MVLESMCGTSVWSLLRVFLSLFRAKAEQPDCLRARYGTDNTQNATHGSDSVARARREINFFFPNGMAAAGVGAAGHSVCDC